MPADSATAPAQIHSREIRGMLDDPAWVNRRVEQIAFIDDQTARRRISVDFRLPESYAGWEEPRGRWFVPLALLRKERPLVDFDLHDEERRSLPLVTREQSRAIAAGALVDAVSTVLDKTAGRRIGKGMVERLKEVVACPPGEAERALGDAFGPGRWPLDGLHRLAEARLALRLAHDFAESYLVLTEIDDPRRRRLVKLSFRERLEVPALGPASALGLRALPFRFPEPGAGMAGSFHCEASAPKDLEIVAARLSLVGASPLDERPGSDEPIPGERVHLRLSGLRSADTGMLELRLRASRPGLIGAATMLALGVSVLLTAGVVFHGRVADSNESATGLLVAVPALVGAYIARPEHLLAKRLLRGVTWLAGGVGVLAFIAAAAAILSTEGGDGEVVLMTWTPLAALAWLATLVLILGSLQARREDRDPLGSLPER